MLTLVLLALWIVVLIQLIFILALARQVGRILMRLGPSGATPLPGSQGLKMGEKVAPFETTTSEGRALLVPTTGKKSLVAFLSFTDCESCRNLVDALCTFASSERDHTQTIAVPATQAEINGSYVRRLGQAGVHVILDMSLRAKFGVRSYPYAFVVDDQGVVQAKGLVNTLEHVENLVGSVEAMSGDHIALEERGNHD